ncbi:MAG: hypothetical protein AAGD07_04870 [Planctomycetota bacterium]
MAKYRDKLITVVSANDLRTGSFGISQGLSWERTVEDTVAALNAEPYVSQLAGCGHFLVTFSSDGVLWVRKSSREQVAREARPFFYPSSFEGQSAEQCDGSMFGYLSCMVTAVASESASTIQKWPRSDSELVHSIDFSDAIASGLAAMRDLYANGHGQVDSELPLGFPVDRLAHVITKTRVKLVTPRKDNTPDQLSRCWVPWEELSQSKTPSSDWSIAVHSQHVTGQSGRKPIPMSGLAQLVVFRGKRAIRHLPNATFGDLFTIDRNEIETLRTLRKLMKSYRDNGGSDKPLSFGVFAPPVPASRSA